MESRASTKPDRLRWYWAIVYFFTVFVVLAGSGLVLSLCGFDLQSPIGLAAVVLISAVAMIGLAWVMTQVLCPTPWKALRLAPTTLRDTLTACAGITGLGIAVDALLGLLAQMFPEIFDEAAMRVFFDAFGQASPAETVLLTACLSLCPGIAEEVGFRGLVLRSFERSASAPVAIAMSALLFGVMHANALQGTGAGLLGVYLGVVTWRTGSLIPAMAAHATNNLLSSINAIQHTPDMPLFEQRPWWMPIAGLTLTVFAVARLRVVPGRFEQARVP